jgi:hypothetical protein
MLPVLTRNITGCIITPSTFSISSHLYAATTAFVLWHRVPTNSMEQSPWEANSQSASHEISCLLWNPRAHYCTHKSPPQASNCSQMNPVHTSPHYFPEVHSNIILPSMQRTSEWSLPFTIAYFYCLYNTYLTLFLSLRFKWQLYCTS